ncbi:hypothetical protein Tco_0406748, partial [Tanacetum coccineum]
MDADKLPKIDPYKEVAQQGQATPPSPAYVPDPMELEHHDPEEDPINYAVDADDDEDEEEESFEDDDDDEEEHLAPADPTAVA